MSSQLPTSNGMVTIRQADPKDAALLRELRLEALANHPEAFAADYNRTVAESTEMWVERLSQYATESEGVICIAIAENQLVGMSGLFRGNRPKTQHSGTIWGVYVKANWRGFHVAEALVEQCITWAQAKGVTIVKLAVVMTNMPAIRCYVRCGFTVYGIEPKAIYYQEVYYDELLMAKQI